MSFRRAINLFPWDAQAEGPAACLVHPDCAGCGPDCAGRGDLPPVRRQVPRPG